jgi:hypothetical protein
VPTIKIDPYSENPLRYSPNDDGWWARELDHDILIMMDGGLYLVGDSSYNSYFNLNQIKSPCEQ